MTGDVLPASYTLVEKPEEDKPPTSAQEQQKATRAQAVVQGITPAQPAPMKVVVEEAKPSILGKLFGWFKTLGAEEQPEVKPASGKPRSSPHRERSERGEGGKRRERGARGERSESGGGRDRNEPRNKAAQAEAAAKPQEPRQQGEREPRPQGEPRQPRPPRPPRVAEEKAVLETQAAAPITEQAEEGGAREGSRRRGRRGGQRERQRRESSAPNPEVSTVHDETVVAQQPVEQIAAEQAIAKPTEYIALPDGFAYPTEHIAMPVTATQQVAPTTEVRQVMPEATAQQSGAVAEVDKVSPVASSNSEGLIQIETDPSKFNASADIPADHAPQPTTRRRVRQREVYVENEPLVQIETQRPQA
jgi:ribonuclease E